MIHAPRTGRPALPSPLPHGRRSLALLSGRLAPVALAALVAGCAAGIPPVTPEPSPASDATAAPAGSSPVAGSPGQASASPTVGPVASIPATPPAASLVAGSGQPVAGELGSWTWIGAGSDAPWIVVRATAAVEGPGPYAVAFAPPVPVTGWTAAWAPIEDGRRGAVAGFEEGGSDEPSFDGPGASGSWSLKLDVRFAGGDSATWYWRLRP